MQKKLSSVTKTGGFPDVLINSKTKVVNSSYADISSSHSLSSSKQVSNLALIVPILFHINFISFLSYPSRFFIKTLIIFSSLLLRNIVISSIQKGITPTVSRPADTQSPRAISTGIAAISTNVFCGTTYVSFRANKHYAQTDKLPGAMTSSTRKINPQMIIVSKIYRYIFDLFTSTLLSPSSDQSSTTCDTG